jgi:O-acetyl-ADP-ribose deacetylase (regulator of RNase III)
MTATSVAREDFEGGRRFEVVLGDLLDEPVDAIVNAANSHLAHGGGVAALIARAAGAALEEDGRRVVRDHGPVAVGDAVVTTAGRLRFKGVIHAVGPQQGVGREGERLAHALVAAFRRADEKGWGSVSFPAVSSGIFAVPLEVCARAYVQAVREFFRRHPQTSVRVLRLCLLAGPLVGLVREALEAPDQPDPAVTTPSRG